MDTSAEYWIVGFVVVFLLLAARAQRQQQPIPWVHILFFCSGFPALIYQIVWQRALFAIYGINIQSVTVVVSAFMLGLGLGSLAGGELSKTTRWPLIVLFATAELGTAGFGFQSLKLFRRVADFTAGSSASVTALATFALIIVPTLLMGATLPILVEHLARSSRNIGSSVGSLYFANTLGSGVACFIAADVLMRLLGQSGSIRLAASINGLVGVGAIACNLLSRHPRTDTRAPFNAETNQRRKPTRLITFPLALACSSFCGFAALAYEIIWYWLLAFATGDIARAFASLLGSYLLGLALGARFVQRHSERCRAPDALVNMLSGVVFGSSILAFAVAPLFAYALKFVSPIGPSTASGPAFLAMLLAICLGASFFGATFPLIAHVSVDPSGPVGAGLSYLYATNIAGSALGSFLVGFVLMDHLSSYSISLLLLAGGTLFAGLVLIAGGDFTTRLKVRAGLGIVTAALFVLGTRPILATIYDRLLFKNLYPAVHFQQLFEGRSGTIGVAPNGSVYGGGVYDGRFNVDLMHDVNMAVRPYALSAIHPAPRRVLMVGLGSGSWAQIIANQPQLEELTVVEINPGYLRLLSQYSAVASLLSNPKVRITIDDGRRWLVRNPEQKFDAIVMNTSFHWRNHMSNLLSAEFLRIARSHLAPGGVLFYNTTGSEDVMATGLAVYPHAFLFLNCLAVSDSPIVFDRARWKTMLLRYAIDGKPIIDVGDPRQTTRLSEIVNIPEDPTGKQSFSIETEDQLRKRLQGRLIITDDNMGVEWR